MTILDLKSETHEGIEDAFHAVNGINPKDGGPIYGRWEKPDGFFHCTTEHDESLEILTERLSAIGCVITAGKTPQELNVWIPENRFF